MINALTALLRGLTLATPSASAALKNDDAAHFSRFSTDLERVFPDIKIRGNPEVNLNGGARNQHALGWEEALQAMRPEKPIDPATARRVKFLYPPERPISCPLLAMHEVKSMVNYPGRAATGRSRAEWREKSVGTVARIEQSIGPEYAYDHNQLEHSTKALNLVSESKWGEFISAEFAHLSPGELRCYLLKTGLHYMALLLRHRAATAEKEKRYSVIFYDPNHTVSHLKINAVSADQLRGLPLSAFLDSDEIDAYFDSERLTSVIPFGESYDAVMPPDDTEICVRNFLDEEQRFAPQILRHLFDSNATSHARSLIAERINGATASDDIFSFLNNNGEQDGVNICALTVILQNGDVEGVNVFFDGVFQALHKRLLTREQAEDLVLGKTLVKPGVYFVSLRNAIDSGHSKAISVYLDWICTLLEQSPVLARNVLLTLYRAFWQGEDAGTISLEKPRKHINALIQQLLPPAEESTQEPQPAPVSGR